jgi:hypothetical protein
MAVKLNNGIIEAYLAGKGLAEQKIARQRQIEQDKIAQEDKKKKEDFEQKKFEEGVRQFDDQLKLQKLTQAALNAQREVQTQLMKSEMQKEVLKSGMTPPDYKVKSSESIEDPSRPGYAGTKNIYAPENEESGLPTFEGVDSLTYAKNEANIQEEIDRPKNEQALRIKDVESQAKLIEQAYKQKFDDEQADKQRKVMLEVARIRSANTNNPMLKLQIHDATPLSIEEARQMQVPSGTTYGQIKGQTPGIKPSSADETKITYLKEMLGDLIDARALIDPDFGGIGYDKYFYGRKGITNILSGAPSEMMASLKGEGKESHAAIRTKLVSAFDKRKVESAGKVLNATEFKILRNYSIPYEHTLMPAQGKSNLDESIKGIMELIGNLEKQYKPTKPGDNNFEEREHDPVTGKRIK